MSRIDDALTRVTGKPGQTPKRSLFGRFVSETKNGHGSARAEAPRYPTVSDAARRAIEARDVSAGTLSQKTKPRLAQDLDPIETAFGLQQVANYGGFACRA